MVETLLDRHAEWLSGKGPEADLALCSQCRLSRNLADFPFPNQCAIEEKQAIHDRLTGIFDNFNMLATGSYWPLEDLNPYEARLLMERRLISPDLIEAEGARGVYVSDDQCLSISINDENHVTVRAIASGLNLRDIWDRVNLIDDTLSGVLDFAFDSRLGYLTTSIAEVGTALKATAILHLPALVGEGAIASLREELLEKRHVLEPLYGPTNEALGDLYQLVNQSTLGRSEEETLFHVKHLAAEILDREQEGRKENIRLAPLQLEDRVARAVGTAQRARLLAFGEALSVLSSLRLGVAQGLLSQYSLSLLNDVFMESQNAHVELRCAHDCDELALNTERADLFRERFV